jgi:hypothetical protein
VLKETVNGLESSSIQNSVRPAFSRDRSIVEARYRPLAPKYDHFHSTSESSLRLAERLLRWVTQIGLQDTLGRQPNGHGRSTPVRVARRNSNLVHYRHGHAHSD